MPEPSLSGERLARLEERSVNLERTTERVEKKVDALDGRLDTLEGTVREALGGFRFFAYIWGGIVALAGIASPWIMHALGIGK